MVKLLQLIQSKRKCPIISAQRERLPPIQQYKKKRWLIENKTVVWNLQILTQPSTHLPCSNRLSRDEKKTKITNVTSVFLSVNKCCTLYFPHMRSTAVRTNYFHRDDFVFNQMDGLRKAWRAATPTPSSCVSSLVSESSTQLLSPHLETRRDKDKDQ